MVWETECYICNNIFCLFKNWKLRRQKGCEMECGGNIYLVAETECSI